MGNKIYNPTKVVATLISAAGVPYTVRGFGEGDYITVTLDNDGYSKHVGAFGEGRFVEIQDKSGECTFIISDYSADNASIMALEKSKQAFSISIVDKQSNGTLFFAEECVLKKVPDLKYAKDAASENEYVFMFLRGTIEHNGAATT